MANKVLSIKMEEKDIEKLKQYHSILVDLGIISADKISVNGLLKHLLMDYLTIDFNNMMNIYSAHGIAPQYFNPDYIDSQNEYGIRNAYELDEKNYELYLQCYKERMIQRKQVIEKNIQELSRIVDMEIEIFDDYFMELQVFPKEEDNHDSFWVKSANNEIDSLGQKIDIQKKVAKDIKMIEESGLPEKQKRQLVNCIEKYEDERKKHLRMMNNLLR